MSPFFRGQIDLELILPFAAGLLIAGTGGWSDARWNTAIVVMGYGPAVKATRRVAHKEGEEQGYMRGYNTYNPDLHAPAHKIDQPRDSHGRFTHKDG
jgi:hypothetical protein